VQYGARITAISIYLYAGQFLSKQRTAQALNELFGVPISAGTVAAASSRAARDVIGSGFLDRCVTGSSASELGAESPVGWLRDGLRSLPLPAGRRGYEITCLLATAEADAAQHPARALDPAGR